MRERVVLKRMHTKVGSMTEKRVIQAKTAKRTIV